MGASVGSIIGMSAVNGIFNAANNALTNSQNRNLASTQMSWQSAESEINRNFQKELQQYNNEFNEQMMDKQLAWSSPVNQVGMLREAGLNPAVLFSGSSSSPVGSTSGAASAGSAPSGSQPGIPSVGQSVPYQFPNILQSAGSFIKDIADAKHAGADTGRIEKLTNVEFDNWVLKNKGQEMANVNRQLENDILSATKDEKVRQAFWQTQNAIMDAYLKGDEYDLNQLEKKFKDLNNQIAREDLEIKHEQRLQLAWRTKYAEKIILQDLDESRARANQANAQAEESREQAQTTRDLRGWQVGYQQAIAELAQVDSFVKRNTMWEQCESYLAELRAKEMLPDQVEQAIINAKKTNDWFVLNQLLGVVNTGVKAYGTVKGAKTGQQFVDAQNVRNNIQQEYNEYLKSKDKDWTPQWRRSNGVPY